jgi:two-component system response regulator AtoC
MYYSALVIDDEAPVRRFVSTILREEGWEVCEAESAERAYEMVSEQDWAIVFCDVMLGGETGFGVLKRFQEELPHTKVVLMTGHGTAAGALDATALGAYDYLVKPFGIDALQTISRTVAERLLGDPLHRLKSIKGKTHPAEMELIGRSSVFIDVMKQVGRIAATNLPVLLTGESGTGKEVVASALHARSARVGQPFVALNCGAIPSELIESELFGHVKGSFTGADRDRRGLWEEADGGTVFLDEITETTPAFQVKLLRAIQEGEIRRVGSNHTQQVDVRVLAASNSNVEAEVLAGRFRQDLFYRLNAVSINLPPLRERREDIMPLAKRFAEQVYTLNPNLTFSSEVVRVLEEYPWPGNIRELENAVVRAASMCDGTIRVQDLPERVRTYVTEDSAAPRANSSRAHDSYDWVPLAAIEARYVTRVLEHTGGNKQAAARVLSVDRKTLDRMIKRHQIDFSRLGKFPLQRVIAAQSRYQH